MEVQRKAKRIATVHYKKVILCLNVKVINILFLGVSKRVNLVHEAPVSAGLRR